MIRNISEYIFMELNSKSSLMMLLYPGYKILKNLKEDFQDGLYNFKHLISPLVTYLAPAIKMQMDYLDSLLLLIFLLKQINSLILFPMKVNGQPSPRTFKTFSRIWQRTQYWWTKFYIKLLMVLIINLFDHQNKLISSWLLTKPLDMVVLRNTWNK